jgi:hypothetical protein
MDRLEDEFDVIRAQGVDIDSGVELDPTRPAVRLEPRDPEAGPLAIGFTGFPGLIVGLGHWLVEPIPVCGCDACDETAEEERGRLDELVHALVHGRFRERLRVPPLVGFEEMEVDGVVGAAWYEYEIPSESSKSRLSRARAKSLIEAAGGKSSFRYAPWPRRQPT